MITAPNLTDLGAYVGAVAGDNIAAISTKYDLLTNYISKSN